MMICKQAKFQDEKYMFKQYVDLEKCKVEKQTESKQNSFYLVEDGNKKAYTIFTKDYESKEKWVKSISDAIMDLNPSQNDTHGHSFGITTFRRPNTRCNICHKFMKGSIYQGYECSVCRRIVHKSCMCQVTACSATLDSTTNFNPTSISVMNHGVIHSLSGMSVTEDVDYWTPNISEFPWWAEKMSRKDAQETLDMAAEGTFLLRWSDHNAQPVLSLKAMGEVKHMRVYKQDETGYVYLSEARYFNSTVELVNFYRHSPLSESFTGLDCCLRRPVYDTAVVQFPYDCTEASHLKLVQGQRVIIINRIGEAKGWWKGRIGNRMGYFPMQYVTLDADSWAACISY